jgi:hypothetical protein
MELYMGMKLRFLRWRSQHEKVGEYFDEEDMWNCKVGSNNELEQLRNKKLNGFYS